MMTMRWIATFSVCQLLALLLTAASVDAQTKVALVDIGQVFKSHPSFTQELEALKSEAEQFKASSMELQQQMIKKAEVLRQYEPGSEDFKRAESALAQESAAIEVEQRNKMRVLMQREAQVHYDTYQQIQQTITEYCDDRGIQLVMRHNSLEMDADNPQTIMQKVNGSVVYYHPGQNITDAIVAALSR